MTDIPPYYETNVNTDDPLLDRSSDLVVLDDVHYDYYVDSNDLTFGATWPPVRFRQRDKRFDLLQLLWSGGWPSGVKLGSNPVMPNLFASYTTRLANLLLMSEPTTPAAVDEVDDVDALAGQRNPLVDVCYDALSDLVRYGGCILVRADTGLIVASPLAWYPDKQPGVHHFVRRKLVPDEANGTDTTTPNVLEITTYADNTLIVTEVEWNAGGTIGTIGETIDINVVSSDAAVEVIPRDPRNGVWGTSKYLSMYSAALEIARRYSTNSGILDLYSGPVPVFQDSDADAAMRYGVEPSDDADERQAKILAGQLGVISEKTIHLPDNLLSVSYLQPNVQGVTYALTQSTDLREYIRDVTGLPDLTGQTVSGDALKRLYVHFYSETAALQLSLRLGLERLLKQMVDWPHVFDSDMFAAPIMSPPSQPAETESASDG